MAEIKDIGEWEWIRRLTEMVGPQNTSGILGIGDDAAVIPWNEHEVLLVSTDALIEGTHFLTDRAQAEEIGHKALAVNLSDIAAMGGTPLYVFLSLGVKPETSMDWLEKFMAGFLGLTKKHGVALLGGDTTKSRTDIMLNITVIGRSPKAQVKLRSMAKPDDLICVTGQLGDSAAGLKLLLEAKSQNAFFSPLTKKHLTPLPKTEEGRWLSRHTQVHAMMDLSDGLESDIQHILKASKCGATIELNQIPVSDELVKQAKNWNLDAHTIALSGGEDYQLLFTIDPSFETDLKETFRKEFNSPVTVIGTITRDTSLTYTSNSLPVEPPTAGWKHF